MDTSGNGVWNYAKGAAQSTTNLAMSPKDKVNLKKGEDIKKLVLYNQSRGKTADVLESIYITFAGWVKNVHDNLSFNKYGNELTGISAGLRVYWKYLTGSIIYSKGFTSPSNIDQNNHIVYVNISLLF